MASALPPSTPPLVPEPSGAIRQATRLAELSGQQWRSGIAAWLGWLFDGLDMHLYTLVATPFVAQLLALPETDTQVGYYGSLIQGAFLLGWAVGGGFFGRLGDRLGRARALVLTILTYALFTGLSFVVLTWWQLLVCRFLAALGIGGEWAVGASLLSETWPRRWRPWIAATLQSAVNCGILLAMIAGNVLLAGLRPLYPDAYPYRCVFLLGILPALLVVWIRRAVPEPEEWHAARRQAGPLPGIAELFRGPVARTTALTILVCAFSLTAHWAYMYWFLQHVNNLLVAARWDDAARTQYKAMAMIVLMIASIAGNFVAAAVARRLGYRGTISLMCVGYFLALLLTYGTPRTAESLWWGIVACGMFQGLFALFTMYLPPLFPTLLRTTGAGFCYNIGRVVAAAGTVFFGLFSQVGDHRLALYYAGFLFLPAAVLAWALPHPPDEA